jgi:ankyrin repeat protein
VLTEFSQVLLLSVAEVIEMAIEELISLATDLVKPFINDPRYLEPRDCMPIMKSLATELRNFATNLESRALQLCAGPAVSRAQAALRNKLFVQRSTWASDPSTLQKIYDNIASWDALDYPGLSHALQMRFFLEQPKRVVQNVDSFLSSREHFLSATAELFGHLPIEIPTTVKHSQMFVPSSFSRVPLISTRLKQRKAPDCLGRSMSQILYDAGSWPKWSTEDIHNPDVLGRTGLYLACRDRNLEAVYDLLVKHASLNIRAANGLWPLDIAIISGDTTIMKTIWKETAKKSPDDRYDVSLDVSCRSPLMWAAFRGNEPFVRYIHTHPNKHPNKAALFDGHECSAIGLAAMQGHLNVVKYLSGLGSCDIPDRSGRSPFWYAAANSHRHIMGYLQYKKAFVDRADNEGLTPLAIAAMRGHAEVVSDLLDQNSPYAADINVYASTNSGSTPLQLAASSRQWKCVRLLLARGIRLQRGMSTADAERIELYAKADYRRAIQIVQENCSKEGCKVFSDYFGLTLVPRNKK